MNVEELCTEGMLVRMHMTEVVTRVQNVSEG